MLKMWEEIILYYILSSTINNFLNKKINLEEKGLFRKNVI